VFRLQRIDIGKNIGYFGETKEYGGERSSMSSKKVMSGPQCREGEQMVEKKAILFT